MPILPGIGAVVGAVAGGIATIQVAVQAGANEIVARAAGRAAGGAVGDGAGRSAEADAMADAGTRAEVAVDEGSRQRNGAADEEVRDSPTCRQTLRDEEGGRLSHRQYRQVRIIKR